ncbi:hypothetical protein BsWGS_17244 [Bradybaena similaris]
MRSLILKTVLLMTACVDGRPYVGCPAGPVCYTKSCISVADEILTSMDESVNPCDDFYQYACGGWIERIFLTPKSQSEFFTNTSLLEPDTRNMLAESHKPTDLRAERKAKSLYASCLKHTSGTTEDAAIVRAVTDRFGRWPLGCSDCNVTEYDLKTFLVEATQIGVHPLFKLIIDPRFGYINSTTKTMRRILYFKTPELGLSTADYASFNLEPEYRQIYADTIYAAAKRFGIDDHDRAKQDAMEIVKVEETLAKVSMRSDRSVISLEGLDADFGQLMNWTSFVTTLASSPSVGVTDVHSHEDIHISGREVLKGTVNYFLQLPARTQVNYIIWRVVDSLQSVLLDINEKLGVILEHAVSDDASVPVRDADCANFVSVAFHLVVYRRHYREHLPDEKLRTVNAMVNQMKDAFKALLPEHNWLDEMSSQYIEDKIEYITAEISFLRAAMNTTFLEAYYANVTIDENNFINNVIAVRKDTFLKQLQTIRTQEKMNSPTDYPTPLGYIILHTHEMYFSHGLLQAPWFVDNAPMSLNYAGTGFVLGHELLHSVAPRGVFIHKNGTKDRWLGNATIPFFLRVIPMIRQYDRYYYKPAEMHVDGQTTVDENIADNGGMKLAYRVYRNYTSSRIPEELKLPSVNFTNDQVFFLRAAQLWCAKESKLDAQKTVLSDNHSPTKFRINGPFQNSHNFADAFGCQPGSPMNPVKKYEVW